MFSDWLPIFYACIGVLSLILNGFTIFLVLFKSMKIDRFRYCILAFQILCTFTDILLTFLMQPVPLFPIMAAYCSGLLAKYVWAHYLVVPEPSSSSMAAQIQCLIYCFLKKHRSIGRILERQVIPDNMFVLLEITTPVAPVVVFVTVLKAGLGREEQMGYLEKAFVMGTLPVLPATTLPSLPKFGHLQLQSMVLHHGIRRLLAQLAAASLCFGPPLLTVVVVMLEFRYTQLTIQCLVVIFASHSTINALVLVLATPPYRKYVFPQTKK
nr:hypothetical protein F22E5.10 - Caenorhabditis elegans [Caenorhabditis elegans]